MTNRQTLATSDGAPVRRENGDAGISVPDSMLAREIAQLVRDTEPPLLVSR